MSKMPNLSEILLMVKVSIYKLTDFNENLNECERSFTIKNGIPLVVNMHNGPCTVNITEVSIKRMVCDYFGEFDFEEFYDLNGMHNGNPVSIRLDTNADRYFTDYYSLVNFNATLNNLTS